MFQSLSHSKRWYKKIGKNPSYKESNQTALKVSIAQGDLEHSEAGGGGTWRLIVKQCAGVCHLPE